MRQIVDASKEEIRSVIKFLWAENNSPIKIYARLLSVYANPIVPSKKTIRQWCRQFEAGRVSVLDEKRPGAPTRVITEKNIGKIKEMIPEDSSIPIRTVADRIDLSYTSARKIIRRDLRMKKKVAKWIPHVLTNEQKHCRLELSSIHRQRFSTQEFLLDRIVTGDESWCYHYDPEIKNQSKRWCKHVNIEKC